MTKNTDCAWATREQGIHIEALDVVASRIARADSWQGWVWIPQAESWQAWWQLPELVAAVAAQMPPPPKAPSPPPSRPRPAPRRTVAKPASGRSSRAIAAVAAQMPPPPKAPSRPQPAPRRTAAKPASGRASRAIRKAPPDLETFLRLAAQRQGARAEARFDREARRRRGDWREVSLLRAFGYNVTKADGLSRRKRREILDDFLHCELPRQWEGRAAWKPPATSARLDKVVGFILNHNVRLAEADPRKEDAVAKWTDDAEWLQATFGSTWR